MPNLAIEDLLQFKTQTDLEIIGDAAHPDDDFLKTHDTYSWYKALGRALAPVTILEFGVRYGYSAIAMLQGVLEADIDFIPFYVGVDAEADGIFSNQLALSNIIRRSYGKAAVSILKTDTQTPDSTIDEIDSLGVDEYKLIHIDGAHSPEGVQNEIKLAWAFEGPGTVYVIDDCDVGHVKAAGLDFARELGAESLMLPTIHQTLVIQT